MKVSWQVTGVRKDPWANASRIEVEEDKPNLGPGFFRCSWLVNTGALYAIFIGSIVIFFAK